MSETAPENNGVNQAQEAPSDERCAETAAAQEESMRGLEMFTGPFDDPRDAEWEERQMAARSIVHGSDPNFRPCVLPVNGEDWLVELGPRMTRVYNMYYDPDDALDVCGDYGRLMDVEYVGKEKTLIVRVHCEPAELPFPQAIFLEALPENWENECGEYGRVDFEGGVCLPVRGYRIKTTSLEDKSAICARRLVRSRVTQAVPVEVGLIPQPNVSAAVPIAASQQPQATPVGGAVAYPLQVGRLTVYDAEWDFVTFQTDRIGLSPEMKKVFRAMQRLAATSEGTAKTKKDILTAAGLPRIERSLCNVMCPSGTKYRAYKDVFAACISKVEQRTPKYYLTQ